MKVSAVIQRINRIFASCTTVQQQHVAFRYCSLLNSRNFRNPEGHFPGDDWFIVKEHINELYNNSLGDRCHVTKES